VGSGDAGIAAIIASEGAWREWPYSVIAGLAR
jgi:hypothetical protein